MIAMAVICSILAGYIASAIGYSVFDSFQSLGPIVSVAVMGAFILTELKKR